MESMGKKEDLLSRTIKTGFSVLGYVQTEILEALTPGKIQTEMKEKFRLFFGGVTALSLAV